MSKQRPSRRTAARSCQSARSLYIRRFRWGSWTVSLSRPVRAEVVLCDICRESTPRKWRLISRSLARSAASPARRPAHSPRKVTVDVLPAAAGAPTGRAAAVRTSARTRVQPGGRIATGSGGRARPLFRSGTAGPAPRTRAGSRRRAARAPTCSARRAGPRTPPPSVSPPSVSAAAGRGPLQVTTRCSRPAHVLQGGAQAVRDPDPPGYRRLDRPPHGRPGEAAHRPGQGPWYLRPLGVRLVRGAPGASAPWAEAGLALWHPARSDESLMFASPLRGRMRPDLVPEGRAGHQTASGQRAGT